MRLCDRLTTRTKNVHIYAQGIAKWTELRAQEQILCNSLEAVSWRLNPVQVMLCSTCGIEGCASDGYVQISRLGDYVLWTPPIFSEDRVSGAERRLDALSSAGSLLFPLPVWIKKIGTSPAAYPTTTRADLLLAWLLEYCRYDEIVDPPALLAEIRQRLVCGDHLDNPTLLQHLEQLAAWFEAAPTERLHGRLVQAGATAAQVETLHLEDPTQEWPALAVMDGKVVPAFGKEWLYLGDE